MNEPQSLNDQTDQPQDASDSMAARASATSTSEAAVATERGEMYSLPSFSVAQEPNFMWAGVDGVSFTDAVDSTYTEVIHWRRNVFKVPSGKAGKAFVAEMSHLIRAYAEGSTLETIALKCAMIMPALLLQKPHKTSKAKDHILCLERRMRLWEDGDLDALLHEGHSIQDHFAVGPQSTSETQLAQTFARLTFQGKVKSAMRLLTRYSRGDKLNLDDLVPVSSTCGERRTVRDILLDKHPTGKDLKPSAVAKADMSTQPPHPVVYEQIDGPLILSVSLRTDGAAGLSGIEAAGWKRLLSSFQGESEELCKAVAMLARRISSQLVDPSGLTAFTACRLVALDKCPGVRPISIGEVLRRIVGKAILAVIGPDVQRVTGALQVCTGQHGGCEAAVHAMSLVFQDPTTEAVLLVDATNAFNCLNRKVALQNIVQVCPSIAPAIINTYRTDPQLCIDGEVIYSQEGTTQGDPFAMAMYAIATLPLIHHLAESASARQVWFADDATAGGGGGQLHHLKDGGTS